MFESVNTNVSFPDLENEILEWWNANNIIEQSLQSGDPDRPFVFYEGPPTANGQPGFHHTISRIFKDTILRYRAMQGYRIIGRREGWDTHGLPVEIEVEKELGFSGKPDIENYGIAAFNAKCKESVWRYIQHWKKFTNRIAYWVSEDAYITYENDYIESLWWIFRQLWDRGLLFRDYKVTMHCPRCDTSLSDHEVSQGFQENVPDPSVWVRFRLTDTGDLPELVGCKMVAWTTTPWTLPANVALCVLASADYAIVPHTTDDGTDEKLIVAAALVSQIFGEDCPVESTVKGEQLVGMRYERLFQGVPSPDDTINWDDAYRVIADDFVSLDEGTGIVHIAPAYGDLEIGKRYHLPTLFSVALNGETLPDFDELGFGSTFFKEANPIITRNLKERGLLFKAGQIHHSYPFCWRCNTPLLHFAKRSWYIRTTAMKEQLIANNQQIYWVPSHIRDGRFGNWLENNIDWAISRERYWGTPLPVWVSDDGKHMECIGSLAELEAKVGRSLKELDLHRPYVDDLTWEDPNGHGTMRRISDVADCWFDSGAMQVAQWHYPFEQEDTFTSAHPADYICEAVDQTRGWFYTLHALGTLLFNTPAFTHVICLGHILDAEGYKMSKSRGNIVDPWQVFADYGVDALRWNLFSAAPPGNPRRFSVAQVGESLRQFLLTLWNTYGFFVTYANLDGWTPPPADRQPDPDSLPLIDRWALARLNGLVRDVTASMEAYDVTSATRAIDSFVDDLSNWYVRRNRRRFWKSEADADKQAAYATLYTCLVTVAKLTAPFTPFISEAMYRNLVVKGQGEGVAASVHLAEWTPVNEALLDDDLVAAMAIVMNVVSLGRAARKTANYKVRQPLSEVWVRVATPSDVASLRRFEDEVCEELNIKEIRYLDAASDFVEYTCKPNLRLVGKRFGKQVPALTQSLRSLTSEQARAVAHAVEAGKPVEIVFTGEEMVHVLQPDELLIETSSPEGFTVAESNGILIALNTTITPELEMEGMVREIVRNIQDARKNAGLEISDKITLALAEQGCTILADLIGEWGDYIKGETLAESLSHQQPTDGMHTEQVELDQGIITLGIARSTG
jgi:isoleucyl-tRNA synthetase